MFNREAICYLIKLKWWLSFWERERTNHHMAAVAISHKCICTYFGNRCIWLEFTVNGIFSHHKLLRSCVCCTVFIEMLWFFHMGRVSVWLLYPKIETHRKNHDKCSIFALHFDLIVRSNRFNRSFICLFYCFQFDRSIVLDIKPNCELQNGNWTEHSILHSHYSTCRFEITTVLKLNRILMIARQLGGNNHHRYK